jgi:site-specific recombinase XerD
MEDHIRPAAKRAGITKRSGWHTLRHTFGTLLKANGEDVVTVQALMRHANVSVTMNTYVQAVTPAKRRAQRGIIKLWNHQHPMHHSRMLFHFGVLTRGLDPCGSCEFHSVVPT